MRRGADCSHTLKALLSPDMRRSGGKGRSKGSRTISWMEYRTLWDGVSVAFILRFYPERVETKRGNGAQGMVRADFLKAAHVDSDRKAFHAGARGQGSLEKPL